MTSSIVQTREYIESLKKEYIGIKVPVYKFKEWYSAKDRVFFNCAKESLESCLEETLSNVGYSRFQVFFIVMSKEVYLVEEVSYLNISNACIKDWIIRFEKNLKPATLMSLDASGKRYVAELGFSYET